MPYYIAEIYAVKKNYDKAQIVAQNYLSAYPQNEHAAEMYRILGDAYYHFGDYHKAVAYLGLLAFRVSNQMAASLTLPTFR